MRRKRLDLMPTHSRTVRFERGPVLELTLRGNQFDMTQAERQLIGAIADLIMEFELRAAKEAAAKEPQQ